MTTRTLCVALPICLIIESDGFTSSKGLDPWKWPVTLNPLANSAAGGNEEVVYDLVGRVFHHSQKSHYRSRFVTTSKVDQSNRVYDYDGLEQNGYPILLPRGTVNSCLVGKDTDLRQPPKGYTTRAVVYHLRGGYDTQLRFLRCQLKSLKRLHNLSFSSDDLVHIPKGSYIGADMVLIPDSDRYWMRNPYKPSFVDYHQHRIATVPGDSGLESEEEVYQANPH